MDPEYEENESWWTRFKSSFAELLEFIAIVGAILVIIRFFVAEPHKVSGHSMVPNFQDSDYIITNKISLRLEPIKRGEVIILENPRNTSEDYIKRVIGLPGDKIKLSNGDVFLNDSKLPEPYLPADTMTYGGTYLANNTDITIQDNQYFVMGDNRGGSSDSREWGQVKQDLIVGQAWLRYWPPQKFTLLKVDTPSQ